MEDYTYKLTLTVKEPSEAQQSFAKMYACDFDAAEEVRLETMSFYFDTQDKVDKALQVAKENSDIWEISTQKIAVQNWNAKWEADYEKVTVNKKCEVIAPFHEPSDAEFTVIIEPQMSFGTGHHATTYLMIEAMLELDFGDKKVLDMGAGSGVLSILAAQKGASQVDAVEIEKMAVENIAHNMSLNDVSLGIYHGGLEVLEKKDYDIILANINKNVLLGEKTNFKNKLKKGGKILLSGFYERDITEITASFESVGFSNNYHKTKQEWALIVLDT